MQIDGSQTAPLCEQSCVSGAERDSRATADSNHTVEAYYTTSRGRRGWEITLAHMTLDLAIYLRYVMFHSVPALLRLHFVHYEDLDFDVTTGLGFHTLKILFSVLIKVGAVCHDILESPARIFVNWSIRVSPNWHATYPRRCNH